MCYYDKPDTSRQQEFISLIKSAEDKEVALISGRINRKDVTTFLTKGRLQQLKEQIIHHRARQVFIDAELTGIQLRNLMRELKIEVIDRTGLILMIFAKRAKSLAGKMQVQLAKMQYEASHLVHIWTHLERQRGALGKTGGPGEKQIELDRRILEQKIKKLKKDLKTLGKQRQAQRKKRIRSNAFTIALVGYTNTGKSTLFNCLTKANSLAKDQLFASLDAMARSFYIPTLPHSQNLVALDTVGFIRDLPHSLIEAFHATLEETRLADLLLIIGDISDNEANLRYLDVDKVLAEIGVEKIPRIIVWNKIDLLTHPPTPINLANNSKQTVFISSKNKQGLDNLINIIANQVENQNQFN